MSTTIQDRWRNWPRELRKPVEDVLGPVFDASIFDLTDAESVPYAIQDALSTRRILDDLMSMVRQRNLNELLHLDMGVVAYCSKCMDGGMLIDKDHFVWFSDYLQGEMVSLGARISELVGQPINPDSSNQLADVLFEKLQIHKGTEVKLKRTRKTKRIQVDDTALKAVKSLHPSVPLILEYREISKLKGTFSDPLPSMADPLGRIHTHLRLTRVPTGRMSAYQPNLMQIPARTELGLMIRSGFIAPDGYRLTSHDLSAIEMRCAAHLSEDALMIDLLCDESKDIHFETAARIFGKQIVDSPDPKVRYQNIDKMKERYPAKSCGFLLLYGGSAAGLSEQLTALGLQGWDQDACEKLIAEWYRVYSGVATWVKNIHTHARLYGWVEAPLGRRLWIPQVWSTIPRIREEALRVVQNFPVQSYASTILKLAIAKVWPVLQDYWAHGIDIKPLMPIHDELIHEVPTELVDEFDRRIRPCFEQCTKLKVPIKVGFASADNWGSLEK